MTIENQNQNTNQQQGDEEESLIDVNAEVEAKKDAEGEQETDTTKKFEKPKDLPDNFWDAENGAYKGDEIYKALTEKDQKHKTELDKAEEKAAGLRKLLSQKGILDADVVDAPEKYKIEIADDYKKFVAEDDYVIDSLRKVGHELGLGNKKVNTIINSIVKDLAEKNIFQEPVSEEDQKKARETQRAEKMKALGPSADAIISSVTDFGNELFRNGTFSEEENKVFRSFARDANSVRILQKLKGLVTGKDEIPVNSHIEGLPSKSELDAMVASKQYAEDPAYRAKVSGYFKQLYPDAA